MNARNRNNSNWLVFTLSFLSLLAAMNAVLFNVALLNISKDLSISSSQVSWIIVGYSMVVAIGSITYGKLADFVKIKKLFIIGISLFILGSIIGFINHQTLTIIIIARLLQASGGAAFITLAMISIRKMVEPDKRPGAFAFISVGIALAVGVGPLVGGAITDLLGWPYLFLLMVISSIGIWLLFKFMPKEENNLSPVHFDFTGGILLFALVTTFLLGVNIDMMFFFLSIILLILFKGWMEKAKRPFIDNELFKNITFLRVITIGFIMNVALLANLFLIPLFLENKYAMEPFSIGIIFFIASLFSVLSSLFTGKIVSLYGSINIIYTASIIMIIGFLILGLFSNTNIIIISIAVILTIISYSGIQVALNTLVPQTLNPEKTGVGLGLYNLLNFVGMAFGPAASSKILEYTNSYSLNFFLIALLISGHFLLLSKLSLVQQRTS